MPEGKLGVGELRRAAPAVAAVDLSKVSETLGYEVAGVLGCDFFMERIVQIDFDREELLVLNKLPVQCGQRVKVAFKTPMRPTIKVTTADGKSDDFLIDTGLIGFDSGCLKPRLLETLVAAANGRVVLQTSQPTAADAPAVRLMQTRQISIGELPTAQPVFGEHRENLLSLYFLTRYCVTFDLQHAKIYLQKGKRIRQPDYVDRSGMHLLRREGQAMIQTVDAGSAAASAGLMPGDRIMFIGDLRGDNGSLHVMRGALCAPEAVIPLLVRRADREFKISLRLAPAALELPK
jgi:hypothetical protein